MCQCAFVSSASFICGVGGRGAGMIIGQSLHSIRYDNCHKTKVNIKWQNKSILLGYCNYTQRPKTHYSREHHHTTLASSSMQAYSEAGTVKNSPTVVTDKLTSSKWVLNEMFFKINILQLSTHNVSKIAKRQCFDKLQNPNPSCLKAI